MKMTRSDGSSTSVVKTAHAMFGSGCFWCSEAVYQRVPGVIKVESGYSGGHVKHPLYREVCEGSTGHAEVIRVTYHPEVVGYEVLLDLFWRAHDPTTLNRQGADVGTQYRSVIFYYSDAQKELAEKSKKALDESGQYQSPIVTAIEKAGDFYPAEDYHRDYYNRNRSAPYCRMVIEPKLKKVGVGK
jgi:peptide-methionine (S)-S-oxide reductase